MFLGKLESVAELLSCADLFLLPSEQESFGLVALEAMASGVPVIGTSGSGLAEVVERRPEGDSQAAFLSRCSSPSSYSALFRPGGGVGGQRALSMSPAVLLCFMHSRSDAYAARRYLRRTAARPHDYLRASKSQPRGV